MNQFNKKNSGAKKENPVLKGSLKKLPPVKTKRVASKRELVIDLATPPNLKSEIAFIRRKLSAELKAPMPQDLKPMLAGITDAPFNSEDWQFEIKWDGYRALTYLQNGDVHLRSRNNLSFNEKYKPVHEVLKGWGINR